MLSDMEQNLRELRILQEEDPCWVYQNSDPVYVPCSVIFLKARNGIKSELGLKATRVYSHHGDKETGNYPSD